MTKKQKQKQKSFYRRVKKAYQRTGGKTLAGNEITYIQFRNRVKQRQEAENLNVNEAIRKVTNTEGFVSAADRSRNNFIDAMKKEFKKDFKQLVAYNRRMKDERGRFVSMKKNMIWSKKYNGYVLGGRFLIDVTDSPKQINIIDLLWEEL